MLKIKVNFDADNFICDNVEWVPLDTDNSIIARDFPRPEDAWAFFQNEFNESVLENPPDNHKLVICGIYVFEKNTQKMFKRILLIITPESSKNNKWGYEGAIVEVEEATIQNIDTSPSYNQNDALKEAWKEGYSFAQNALEDQEWLYSYLACRMIDYQKSKSQSPIKKPFEKWLLDNLDSIISEDQFAEPESDACPARDKYYNHLDYDCMKSAFYTGGAQALEDFFKDHSIPKQEEWQAEYEKMRDWHE